ALPAPAPALAAADRLRRLVPGADRAAPGAAGDRRLGVALARGLPAGLRPLRLGIAAEHVERLRAVFQALRLRQLPRPFALRGLRTPGVTGGRNAAVLVAIRTGRGRRWGIGSRRGRCFRCGAAGTETGGQQWNERSEERRVG